MIALLLWASGASAFPVRAPFHPEVVTLEAGRRTDVLIVKLAEGQGLWFDASGSLHGPGNHAFLDELLEGSTALFGRDPDLVRSERQEWDPTELLADLTLYRRIETGDATNRGTLLLTDPRVETAYLAMEPVAPPDDVPPTTPDLSGSQGYLGPAPDGFDFQDAWSWPGGRGSEVTVADVEYSWRKTHEDLGGLLEAPVLGWESGQYDYHGSGVLGEIWGGDNGYGVVGMSVDATPLVASPYPTQGDYDVASMIDQAAAALAAGDVLLIEQQAFAHGNYCPVEVDPAVWDAIALAVAKGVIVVEPGGNGAQDLDDPVWNGWFQRDERDSGAILVGGGASPHSGYESRVWYPNGSSYGSRVDVQGWYDSIATATTSYEPDLFFPNHDYDQAYTSVFGGTSGASPMVTASAAIAQSVALSTRGTPWDPWDLRQALVSTGTPQPAPDASDHPIGPQPDLRRFLRTWAVR